MEEWLERLELFERLRTAISKGFEGRPAFSIVYIFCNNRPFKAAAGVQIPLGTPMKIEGIAGLQSLFLSAFSSQ
jgi:hypothetical protein